MKRAVFLAILCTAGIAHADVLDQDGVVRNDDGTVHYMSHDDAMKACPTGAHMPTVREFTKEAQSLGRNGILEVGQVDPNAIPDDYFKFSVVDRDGKQDQFYYNSFDGSYTRPQNLSLWNLVAWASSVAAVGSTEGYAFNYANGSFLGASLEFNKEAVRCISGQMKR